MAPRGFDRYMLAIGMGTHPKFARLTDGEFRAHVVGVLAVAAMAPKRGWLMVGELPAEPVDVATAAGVPERVAASAMRKLEAVGVLRRDDEHGCLRVHDWHDINPPPGSSTARMRRHRASQRDGGGDEPADNGRHRNVTETSHSPSPEVEVEVEGLTSSLRSDVVECFAYWQERCSHQAAKLTADRKAKITARLREGYTVHDIRQGIDGAARAAFVDERGQRFDDIELICRKGSKLEDFMARATLPEQGGNVVALNGRATAGELIRKITESEAS